MIKINQDLEKTQKTIKQQQMSLIILERNNTTFLREQRRK